MVRKGSRVRISSRALFIGFQECLMGKNNPETLRKYHREYYQKNKTKIKDRVLSWQKQRLDELRRFVYNYLLTHPCVDCGEADPVVLEFDHADNEKKVSAISDMIRALCSNEHLQTEIDKCQVRCANCHRRRTAKAY